MGLWLVSAHAFHDSQRGPACSLVLPSTGSTAQVLGTAGKAPQATKARDGGLVIHCLPDLLQGGGRGVNRRVP